MLPQYPILDALAVMQRLGFDGAEICVEKKDWSWVPFDDDLVAAVREQVARLGWGPCSFSLHQDYIYDDRLYRETERAIRWTRDIGADVFIFSGTKKRTGDQDEWERMVDRTRGLVEVAAECGVIMAEEFEPGFIVGSTTDLLRLFEEIPSPYLAANLDLGHVFLCDPDPLSAIAQLGTKIVHCHVENMPAGIHDHRLPQEGDMDLGAYLAALKANAKRFAPDAAGFDGGLALDVYKYDYEAVAPDAIAYLRNLIP